ncbi:MAG: signal peptidase II [Christensenellales bacterium]
MLQIIIIVLALAADQLSKFLLAPVLSSLPGNTLPVIEGVFHLTYVQNKGASFGMLQGKQPLFIIITVIVLVAATVYIIRGRKTHPLFLKNTLALLWAGAFGNLIDRVVFGYVRDLFDFRIINFWVFNAADSCLVIGAIFLCVYFLFIYKDKPCADKTGEHTQALGGAEKNKRD